MKDTLLELLAGFVAFVGLISGGLSFVFGYIGLRDGFDGILIFFIPSMFVFAGTLFGMWKSRRIRSQFVAWLIPPEFK